MNSEIREWQKTVLPNQSSEEVNSILNVFASCSDLWGVITHTLAQQQIKKNTIRKLESGLSYIRLWADGYGVISERFEENLKNSQRAGDLTIRLLQNICRTLTKELTPIVVDISTAASQDATSLSFAAADLALLSERLAVLVQGDNDSDSDSEASEDGELVTTTGPASREKLLDDIADDLRSDTQCLLDLGARFEEQVINPIAYEAAANPLNISNGGLSDTFIKRVLRLYPECETDLAGRIGNANWLRFLSIAELKPLTSEGRVVQDKNTNTVRDATESELKSIVNVASTRETSLFHDSGLGTASRISESHSNAARTAPENQCCPPLPEDAVWGEPFSCITCNNQVTMAGETEWRAHLLCDIRPYVCPERDCDAPLFSTISQWEKHIDIRHKRSTIWSDYQCRICGDAASDRAMVTRHLIDHMEAIALTIIPRVPGIEAEKVAMNDAPKESERYASIFEQENYRKPSRFRTPCQTCRTRRTKCDGEKPECTSCKRVGRACIPSREMETNRKSLALPRSPDQTPNSKTMRHFPKTVPAPVLNLDSALDAPEDEHQNPPPDSAFVKPPPNRGPHPSISGSSDDNIAERLARNTLAARKYRERKVQMLEDLEEKIAKLERERDSWKNLAIKHGAERA